MSEEFDSTPAHEVALMGGDTEMVEIHESTEVGGVGNATTSGELPFANEALTEKRTSFVSYLMSPVVTLLVGSDGNGAILTAHQALLVQSPFFRQACAGFTEDDIPRQIDLADENVDAIGSFLEFLYTGDYFPKKIPGQRTLEEDPSLPAVDDDGSQLLRHARVYTLADKFDVPTLKQLATSKIHCVNSTAKGEIAYARYVYGYTSADDAAIRAPIANFWATRSHTLRSEAEDEFKALCLEFPQFGYDVLTRVLDEKLKRERSEKLHPQTVSGRKRQRQSLV
ncbi:hypothetical protein SAPIO_CDS1733 [Scedosporium apiospermum]|uniref:BTB domain-containing protein n=1 Tax=Pseudallescheria apiosperma TaxID=563466 RepID=A0A084GDM1_PSEDA|nr:uncharacterized protein SAPIO_CDS1733 [Scedosporium apiospermum]KEZ45433.1 hypothetical protein SAPIO_CDS1733 [Scedosporium apiospermum]